MLNLSPSQNIVDFIKCWSEIYAKKVLVEDKYDTNINIGGFLTKNNIHPLFFWKFHQNPISYKNYVDKLGDPFVLKYINDFRKKLTVEDNDILEFNDFIIQNDLVQSGSIIRTFIIHLGNPLQIPNLDQYIIQTYDAITGNTLSPYLNYSDFLENYYLEYRKYIMDLTNKTGFPIRTIDQAFWYYGIFIL